MIDQEKLYSALEMISEGVTRPTRIAKAMGMTYRSYCNWMVRSNAGDPAFLITFQDQEMQWAAAIKLSTRLALFELRGMVLQESIFGYDEVQTFQGQVVWTPDPVASALSEEDREFFGYRKDGLLEVDGALVPLALKRKAPWAQQARLLEAAFSDMRPTQTVNQNLAVSGAVGVGYAKPVDYSKGPPAIPPPPPPPMPELPAPVDAEFSEIADDDLAELLGPEPEPVAVNVSINIEPPVSREYSDAPTARETSPAQTGLLRPRDALAVTRVPNPTPLQKSLYDAIDAAKARRGDASK